MSAFLWLAALLASLSLSQALLVGCGGQGATSSTTDSASAAGSPTDSTPGSGSVTLGEPHARVDARTQAQRREAGNAASFVEPGADNSVPTFGTEASATQRVQATASLRAYLRARAIEDWGRACRGLARAVRRGYEKIARSSSRPNPPGCPAVLAALSKGTDFSDPLTGPLLSLRVHGRNAFALFYGPGHQRYMVPMNREAGAWRPTQAAPIAYPPGAP